MRKSSICCKHILLHKLPCAQGPGMCNNCKWLSGEAITIPGCWSHGFLRLPHWHPAESLSPCEQGTSTVWLCRGRPLMRRSMQGLHTCKQSSAAPGTECAGCALWAPQLRNKASISPAALARHSYLTGLARSESSTPADNCIDLQSGAPIPKLCWSIAAVWLRTGKTRRCFHPRPGILYFCCLSCSAQIACLADLASSTRTVFQTMRGIMHSLSQLQTRVHDSAK